MKHEKKDHVETHEHDVTQEEGSDDDDDDEDQDLASRDCPGCSTPTTTSRRRHRSTRSTALRSAGKARKQVRGSRRGAITLGASSLAGDPRGDVSSAGAGAGKLRERGSHLAEIV
ncbi:unnamed protein product [Prorocentrum cordatum]|uniref:Uncharacterized protein n=1 Tax=Prorocentrum cordatum TaxID=2364126 RepID=A0ABN9RAX2_9DINO|nr:unnamed protein product [Polarella glacialis]